MDKTKLELRLKELEQQEIQYNWIIEKLFDDPRHLSEEERVQFTEENREKIQELQLIRDEISDIEWELMGPEKQQEYIDKYKED